VKEVKATSREQPISLTIPILDHIRSLDGWFDEAEADLLIAVTTEAVCITTDEQATSIVEVGSYCGKSTIVLGLTLKALTSRTARIYAIDPHDGEVSTLDQGIMQTPPTFEKFSRNLREAGVADVIEPIKARSHEVVWDKPIDLLFIDGLHDYRNVATDFLHFSDWVRPEGFVAFHDYANHFAGVKRLVDELISANQYRVSRMVDSLVVLQRRKRS
jgi:predicted O-methyltransferase YrrM